MARQADSLGNRLFRSTPPFLLFLFLVAASLVGGGSETRPLTWSPLLPAALLLVTVTIAFRSSSKGGLSLPDRTTFFLLFFFTLLLFLSRCRAPCSFDANIRLRSYLASLAFFFTVFSGYAGRAYLPRLIAAVFLSGAFVAVTGLLHYLHLFVGPWTTPSVGLNAPFRNHNHMAGFLEMIIPIGCSLLFARLGPAKKLLIGYCTFLMTAAHIFTLSRGGWIALSLSLVLLVLLRLVQGRRLYVFCGVSVAVTVLLLMIFQIGEAPVDNRLATISDPNLLGRNDVRASLFGAALRMGLSHPLAGVGIGHFVHSFHVFRPPQVTLRPRFVHNDYLQVFAELGFPGFIVVAALLFHVLSCGVRSALDRKRGSLEQAAAAGAFCATAGMMVHSLVDFNMHVPVNSFLFVALAAICLRRTGRRIDISRHSRYVRPAIAVLSLFFLLSLPFHYRLLKTAILLDKGKIALAEGKYGNAVVFFSKACHMTPMRAESWLQLARARRKRARLARIVRAFDKEKECLERAVEAFDEVRRHNALRLAAAAEEGECYVRLAELADRSVTSSSYSCAALVCFEYAAERDPFNPYYCSLLGFHQLRLGHVEEALNTLGRLFRVVPGTDALLDRTIRILMNVLQNPALVSRLVPEGAARGHLTLARVLNRQGRWTEAKREYETALRLSPTDPRILRGYADGALRAGDYELARRLLKREYELRPSAALCLQLSDICGKLDDDIRRRFWLEKAVLTAPDQIVPVTRYADYLSTRGRKSQARRLFERIYDKHPDSPAGPEGLARIETSEKHYHRAVEQYLEAHRRCPDNLSIENQLAWAYYRIGLPIKAYRLWQLMKQRHPEKGWIYANKALAHCRQKEYDEAISELEALSRIDPQANWRGKALSTQISRLRSLAATLAKNRERARGR